ncbi:hypothetical protein MYP_4075 [Sporocytophaga myxococcoides]|uniref:Uncharacterized protein n=1 Tax=Sporocytophaga myxococcoides TaxID=153721 RepID=A0A098LIS6_9BACT|nr:hypothetical protein [Sporocytophaga myxococcoides]GAL86845.1 hypothetical protein MYP_4075 [Sporocytophaga myxococcoides]
MKRYIRYYQPQSFKELFNCIIRSVEDYNIFRPHMLSMGLHLWKRISKNFPIWTFQNKSDKPKP